MKCLIPHSLIILTLALIGFTSCLSGASEVKETQSSSRSCLSYPRNQIHLAALTDQSRATKPALKDTKGKNPPISRGGALLRSLVIPGWGESYLGYKKTGQAFFWTDMAIWTAVAGLHFYGKWREDQFISYGATHAGAYMSGKSDKYYADIGNYNNTDEYNQAKLLVRNYDALYTDPSYFWSWDSEGNRMTYDHFRIQSRSAKNRMYFFFGAAALNRLISLVDTGKKANDILKKQKTAQLEWRVEPGFRENSNEIRLVFSASY
jgi:hypothetical protein